MVKEESNSLPLINCRRCKSEKLRTQESLPLIELSHSTKQTGRLAEASAGAAPTGRPAQGLTLQILWLFPRTGQRLTLPTAKGEPQGGRSSAGHLALGSRAWHRAVTWQALQRNLWVSVGGIVNTEGREGRGQRSQDLLPGKLLRRSWPQAPPPARRSHPSLFPRGSLLTTEVPSRTFPPHDSRTLSTCGPLTPQHTWGSDRQVLAAVA